MTGTTELLTASASDIGPRTRQFDIVMAGSGIIVAADGVSSVEGGDVAAAIAVDEYATIARTTEPDAYPDALLSAPKRIAERIAEAGCDGLTTVAAVLVDKRGRAWATHVGDSTVLVARRSALLYLSQPDTELAEAIQVGGENDLLDQAEAARTPSRILSARSADVVPHIELLRLRYGDEAIVCTDGVTGVLTAPALLAMTGRGVLPDELADAVMENARRTGLRDNAAVAVLHFGAPDAPTPAPRGWAVTA